MIEEALGQLVRLDLAVFMNVPKMPEQNGNAAIPRDAVRRPYIRFEG